jgi:hypothetical protein
MNANETRRELSDIIKLLNKLKFNFVGFDEYAGGDQMLSYAKDGIQIDMTVTVIDPRSAELLARKPS